MSTPRSPRNDYAWVDAGLGRLGLTLDLDPSALPDRLRGGDGPGIDALMETSLAFAAATPPWASGALGVDDGSGRWRVEVGRVSGNPYFVSRTVIRDPARLDRAAFVAFAVDANMTRIAAAWDATYRSALFSHVILRSGEVFAVGERSLAGVHWTDVAKVMRWEFAVPGLFRRELLSVYVSTADAASMTCCYFPVRGEAFGVPPGRVRARLTVPCLDRVEFDGDRCTALVHLASAQLGGWMPRALTTSGGYARAFLTAARGEAEHLRAVADGTGKVGAALAANPRVDGTLLDIRQLPH
jgi:hypothetical protein